MITTRIRELNDALRTSMAGGTWMVTAGVRALPEDVQAEIMARIHSFDAFGPDNDPHGEHDFGKIDVSGHTIFFKIDAYDETMTFASENPSDPTKMSRVLTVMLAEEY